MIVIVVCWIFVGVLTDVKVEVEEACAELPVAVPIADGVDAGGRLSPRRSGWRAGQLDTLGGGGRVLESRGQ